MASFSPPTNKVEDVDTPEDVDKPGNGEHFMGVGSWMACSVGMLVFNKQAIHAFPVPCSLVAIQFVYTVLVLVIFSGKYIHIGSMLDVLRWSRVVPFFTGMLLTSILALEHAPMTLVITFRALSPLVSLIVERFYPKPLRISRLMLVALGMLICGMALYICGMSVEHLPGIGWVILNNFLAVSDRLLQRLMLAKEQNPVDISKTGATLLNNVLGFFPLAIAALFTREDKDVPEAIRNLDTMGIIWICASCVVGAGISYTGIWAQSLISATSFLVLVNSNKFMIIFLEAFVLQAKELSWNQIIGAIISILAGILYGVAREKLEREMAEKGKDEMTSSLSGEESDSR